ncbi:thioesterase family protein [Xylariaceae sp. FL0804]|nr:thioesterase family protein [Xylariaceae sp. FL0804]
MASHAPFHDAIQVERLDSHTYRVNLNATYCVGAVPNGGYAASCMLAAARMHLSQGGLTDTLAAHFEYPFRTSPGPAIVAIEDVKLSRDMSTLQLTLWQDGLLSQAPWFTPSVSRRPVLGYTTQANLRGSTGISMPTGYEVTPAAALPTLPDLELLKTRGSDGVWEESKTPGPANLVRSLLNWHFYVPRQGPLTHGTLDMWIRTASGEPITQSMMPYLVDSFPYNLHTFLAAPEMREILLQSSDQPADAPAAQSAPKPPGDRNTLWFPTLVMNLETKATLPEDGVEFLAVRVSAKQIKNGKFDLEVLVRDLGGDLVALSQHVASIVDLTKNLKKKKDQGRSAL